MSSFIAALLFDFVKKRLFRDFVVVLDVQVAVNQLLWFDFFFVLVAFRGFYCLIKTVCERGKVYGLYLCVFCGWCLFVISMRMGHFARFLVLCSHPVVVLVFIMSVV